MKCCIEGCHAPAVKREMCHKHYQRWFRHGDPNHISKRGPPKLGVNITRKRDSAARRREKEAGYPRTEECEGGCGETRVCFDHDHKTGRFRGWLCGRCNSILGFARDNPNVLDTLARYLRARS